jgi:hypothetical protein
MRMSAFTVCVFDASDKIFSWFCPLASRKERPKRIQAVYIPWQAATRRSRLGAPLSAALIRLLESDPRAFAKLLPQKERILQQVTLKLFNGRDGSNGARTNRAKANYFGDARD